MISFQTNFFRVKNPDEFLAWVEKLPLHVHTAVANREENDNEEETFYSLSPTTPGGDWPMVGSENMNESMKAFLLPGETAYSLRTDDGVNTDSDSYVGKSPV